MTRIRKILIPISGLQLDLPFGAMNAIWQFLKGLYEIGVEPIVVPYAGESRNSLWWRTYPNPNRFLSSIYLKGLKLLGARRKDGRSKRLDALTPKLARAVVQPRWRKLISQILDNEKNIDAVLIYALPLNHIVGLASFIKSCYGIPVVYYDADLPFSLPRYGGFTFNYYPGADLSEYDAICGNSEGVLSELEEMGARRTYAVHFAVDPELFRPVEVENQDIDVFFSAWGERNREKWISELISIPSRMTNARFCVCGGGFDMDMGRVVMMPFLPPPTLRYFISRSKINLSITRHSVTQTMGSNSRPFELASLSCCIVSNPNPLIEKFFEAGKEIFIAHDSRDAIDLYNWLIANPDIRIEAGQKAREKVIADHTFRHRAEELVRIIESLK